MALWNAWDEKLVEIGLAKDKDEAKKDWRNMLRQAVRVALDSASSHRKERSTLEDHMKDRALIGHYLIEHSNGVKVETREGKTYYRIFSFESARKSAGELLAEIMRIKAEGDLSSAKSLVDRYGLKVDAKLRDEVQDRAKKLDLPSYTGLVMPTLEPVREKKKKIVEVKVSYPLDLAKQMLEYSQFTKRRRRWWVRGSDATPIESTFDATVRFRNRPIPQTDSSSLLRPASSPCNLNYSGT
jgi:dipeptidyl-peptidase-3